MAPAHVGSLWGFDVHRDNFIGLAKNRLNHHSHRLAQRDVRHGCRCRITCEFGLGSYFEHAVSLRQLDCQCLFPLVHRADGAFHLVEDRLLFAGSLAGEVRLESVAAGILSCTRCQQHGHNSGNERQLGCRIRSFHTAICG